MVALGTAVNDQRRAKLVSGQAMEDREKLRLVKH